MGGGSHLARVCRRACRCGDALLAGCRRKSGADDAGALYRAELAAAAHTKARDLATECATRRDARRARCLDEP